MANYLVSYDLNGIVPTHAQMDQHVAKKRAVWASGRLLETVWYVGTSESEEVVYDYFAKILSSNDRLIVATMKSATFKNLLVNSTSLSAAFDSNL